MNWYKIVNIICYKLSKKYNLELWQVVGILVSLSAQKAWKTNIRQTIEFLKGKQLTGMYSGIQLNTCKKILFGEDPMNIWGKTSFKYRNFYLSILNPEDPNPVCIDTHMINWYLSKFPFSKLNRVKKDSIFANKKHYTLIQNQIRKEAIQNNIIPSHYQAIVWVQQRNGNVF
jgi:hypothetical protein